MTAEQPRRARSARCAEKYNVGLRLQRNNLTETQYFVDSGGFRPVEDKYNRRETRTTAELINIVLAAERE